MLTPTLAAACAFAGGSAFLWQRAGVRSRAASRDAAALIGLSLRALPLAFGLAVQFPRVGVVLPPLACAPAGLALSRALAQRGRHIVRITPAPLLVLAPAVVLWGVSLSESSARLALWSVWAASVAVLVAAISTLRPPIDALVDALLTGLGISLVATVACYVGAGLESPARDFRPDTPTILGTVRVLWPLAANSQIPPTVAALYVVGRVSCRSSHGRAVSCLFLGAAAVTWVLSDNRFVVIAAVLALAGARRFTPRAVTRSALLCVALLSMPWWWTTATDLAGKVVGDDQVAITFASRSDDERELLTLNNRTAVWSASREVLDDAGLWQLLRGYGLEGQRASGASDRYDIHFRAFADPRAASAHNSVLQILFDTGLVGLAVVGTAVGLGFAALRRAARIAPSRAGLATLHLLVVIVASASTEGYLSASFAQLPFWLLVVVLALASLSVPDPSPAPHAAARTHMVVAA